MLLPMISCLHSSRKHFGVGYFLPMRKNVETCCLLERLRNAKDYIPLKLDMEDYYKIKDAEEDKKNDSNN